MKEKTLNKEILWIRKLSCGHQRPTNIAFMVGKYNKPKVGEDCYCRECCQEVKIIGIKEAEKEEVKELETTTKEVSK